MRGLTTYFAFAWTLFLVSGASADRDPNDYYLNLFTHNVSFPNKEFMYFAEIFNENTLMYVVCENSTDPVKECQVYEESIFDVATKVIKPCDVKLDFSGRFWHHVELKNAGVHKAVFTEKYGTNAKLIIMNLKDCSFKEVTLELGKETTDNFYVTIVPRLNNFDAFFMNRKLCHDSLCKATYDYEGKMIKAASGFGVNATIFNEFQIKPVDKDLVVGTLTRNKQQDEHINIAVVSDSDTQAKTLFSSKNRGSIKLATEENKIGFCASVGQKLLCKQYDTEGKSKNIETEIERPEDEHFEFDMHNLKEGFLVLTTNISEEHRYKPVIMYIKHFDGQGKEIKSVEIETACLYESEYFVKLHKNPVADHMYCASIFCRPRAINGVTLKTNQFLRNFKCFSKSALF